MTAMQIIKMTLKDFISKLKRKPKVVETTKEEKKELLLTEIITELKKLGYSDEQIIKKFEEKNYPKEFIVFLIKSKQEVKMAKEKVDVDLEDEEEFDENDSEEEDSAETEDEDLDEESAEEKEIDKKKKSNLTQKVDKKSNEETKPELTLETVGNVLQTIIQNQNDLAQRLQSIEATLYRMRRSA